MMVLMMVMKTKNANPLFQWPIPLFFGMEKNALDVDRVGPSQFLVVQEPRPGSFFPPGQGMYYRARATIDAKTEKKSELADSVAGRKMCVMSVVMFTGILPILWWSCAIYLRDVGSVVIK